MRAAIEHPNVLPARLHGPRGGRIVRVLTDCTQPLLSELTGSQRLGVEECVRILRGACAGAAALIDAGLLPRDLTPDRLYVHPSRGGLVADSGLPVELLPPPPIDADPQLAYRSPEELDGARRDERSVVYSLGALLFASLTGRAPFGGSWSNIYLAHSAAPRPSARDSRDDVPPELDAVIARAMSVLPSDRYSSVPALAVAAIVALDGDARREARVTPQVASAARHPQPEGSNEPCERAAANPTVAPAEVKGRGPRRGPRHATRRAPA